MTPTSDVGALYKNFKVTLWVEDELTRDYLRAAWGPQPGIGILIAGSSENLKPIVQNARKEGFANVYGLRDRDFGSKTKTWTVTSEVFVLDSHEVENFLLDAQALATQPQNTNQLSADVTAQRLKVAATQLTWAMALGATLSWLSVELVAGFPGQGSLMTVADEKDALSRIYATQWPITVAGLRVRVTAEIIEDRLRHEHQRFAAMLDTGDEWMRQFAGKELLNKILPVVAPTNSRSRKSDLAKDVGTFHLKNGRPQEIENLLQLLTARSI